MTYEVIRSKRKTIGIEVSPKKAVIVRVPLHTSQKQIEQVVESHQEWIVRAMQRVEARSALPQPPPLTEQEIEILRQKAKEILPHRVQYFVEQMGLVPQAVTITGAKTRWGSCSGKNRICFSYRLMLLPMSLVDYVVVHELAHIQEKNHGKGFYSLIEKYLPDYKERQKQIKNLSRPTI